MFRRVVRQWSRRAILPSSTSASSSSSSLSHRGLHGQVAIAVPPPARCCPHAIGIGPFSALGQQRGLRYHKRGWWEDEPDKGVRPAPAYLQDEDLASGVYSYVSDRRKEEIYRLHVLAPDIFDTTVLSYLFSVSKTRVEVIIKLKADEVAQRKAGKLYTKTDKLDGSGKDDPYDRLLLTEEGPEETMEDLNRPPLAPKGPLEEVDPNYLKMLALVQAIKNPTTPEGPLPDLSIMDLDPSVLDSTIQALDDQINKLTQERQAAINADEEWESKDLDQMNNGPNMFRETEKIRAAILEDPDFLGFNAVLGLEIRRVQLIKELLRAERDPGATPYDKDEARRLMEDFTRVRKAVLENIATLRLLSLQFQKQAAAKGGEAKEGGEEKKEEKKKDEVDPAFKAAVKQVRQELSRLGVAKIVDLEQLETEVESLAKEARRIDEETRRAKLVQGLRVPSSDKAKRDSLLQEYLKLVLTDVGRERAEQLGAVHDGVKWEVFQEFRRRLHKAKEAFTGAKDPDRLYLTLEDDAEEIISSQWEKLCTSSRAGGGGGGDSGVDVASVVKEGDGGKRLEGVRAVLHDIVSGFDLEAIVKRELGQPPVGDAVMLLVNDVHHSVLREVVDVPTVTEELKAVLEGMEHQDKVVKRAVLKGFKDALAGVGKAVNQQEGDKVEEARMELLGLMADVRQGRVQWMKKLNEGTTLENKSERHQALKDYLGRLFLEVRLHIFDDHSRLAMNRVMDRLKNSFKSESGLQKVKWYVARMIYHGEELTANDRKFIAKLDWDKDPDHIDPDFLDRVVNAIRSEVVEESHGGRMPLREMGSVMSRLALDDFMQGGVESIDWRRRIVRGLREVMAKGVMKQEDMTPLEEEYGQRVPVDRVREVGLLAFAVTPTLLGPQHDDFLATKGHRSSLEQRISEAKEMLDYLRGDRDYQEYVAKIPDEIVEEIEKELLDQVLETSDELNMDLDPELKDLKDRGHYDIPSLRFRILDDQEYAVASHHHDGFSKADEQDAFDHLHPKHHPRQHDVLQELGAANTRGKQRWQLAFKDTSKGVKSPTIVREGTSGRLRVATQEEEAQRSWLKRRSRIDWGALSWRS